MGVGIATLGLVVQFGTDSFGLLHTYGFSLFHQGEFCEPLKTNANSRMWFGVDTSSVPLIFSSAALTDADKPVDGWRQYDIARLCAKTLK